MAKKSTPLISKLGKERAERIKRLREATRLSRPKFAAKYAKYGIKKTSLQNWEDVRWYGLTEAGATMLLQAFQDEGLKVTMEYLMYGSGEDPICDSMPFKITENDSQASEQGRIAEELRFFHQHNTNAVDAMIMDDGLSPWLKPGDYVAGVRYFNHEIENAIGHTSIVQTESGDQLVRIVRSGKDLGYYTLTCSNIKTTVTKPVISDIKLFWAAPVLWIRKSKFKK